MCVYLVIVFILIPAYFFAEGNKRIEISVIGGFNLYSQKFSYSGPSPIPKHSPRLGFHLGAGVNVHLFNRFSIETDIIYKAKKSELVNFLGVEWGDTYYNLHYVALPILLNYKMPFSKIKIFTTLGLEFDFLLKSQIHDKKNDIVIQPIEYIKSSDIQFILGLGIQYRKFSLKISYGLGLMNINAETQNDLVVKNRGLECSVSYSVF